MKKRNAISAASDTHSADKPLAAANSSSVAMNTRLRPTRSAISPNATAPTAMPMELTAPSQPISARLSPQAACKAASTKASSPTSSASNIQPRPEVSNRRLRDTGAAAGPDTREILLMTSPEKTVSDESARPSGIAPIHA